jgi:hypothetical protein
LSRLPRAGVVTILQLIAHMCPDGMVTVCDRLAHQEANPDQNDDVLQQLKRVPLADASR